MASEPASSESASSEEFEEFVAAALKVDPTGMSGKHRKVADQGTNPDPEVDTEP